MILKRYRNELIVGCSFLVMLTALFYKNTQISLEAEHRMMIKKEMEALREIIAYQKIWADKTLSKKIDRLKTLVSSSKVKWSKKGKKLTVQYKELTPKELNKIMTKLMSLAVQIHTLSIIKSGNHYRLECQCKW